MVDFNVWIWSQIAMDRPSNLLRHESWQQNDVQFNSSTKPVKMHHYGKIQHGKPHILAFHGCRQPGKWDDDLGPRKQVHREKWRKGKKNMIMSDEQVTNESKGQGLGDQKAWAFRLCKQILWDQKALRSKSLWDQKFSEINKQRKQGCTHIFHSRKIVSSTWSPTSWPRQNIQKWKHGSTEISGKTFKTSDSHSLYGFVIIWVPNLTRLRCAGP